MDKGKMLRTADFYFKDLESLHLKHASKTSLPDSEDEDLESRSEDSKPSRKTDDQKSVSASGKSSQDTGRFFSSLSTVFHFADFVSTLGKVSSESEIFISLIQRVRHDVTEASRLYTSHAVSFYLDAWPDKKTWVDAILLDVRKALNDIGVYMETLRINGDDGGAVGLRRKFEWVLTHQKKLISKQQYLTLCHQSLMAAVQMMQTVEMTEAVGGVRDPIYEAPARPWVPEDDDDILRSPYARHKFRQSQRNLSLPSIITTDTEPRKAEVRAAIAKLAELPGSTPDDLPHPDNWDLYASPRSENSLNKSSHHISEDKIERQPSVTLVESSNSPRHAKPRSFETLPGSDPSPSQVYTRRSFDEVRHYSFARQQQPRTPLAYTRPRAYSDQVLPPSSLNPRLRRSFDAGTPLPTVTEKPLERNDSDASMTIPMTTPIVAKRYRPFQIQVRRPPTKHQSLPSELPYLPSRTSLFQELSQWVLPNGPERSQSIKRSSYIDVSTPSSTIASSPTLPESLTVFPNTSRNAETVSITSVINTPTSSVSTCTTEPSSAINKDKTALQLDTTVVDTVGEIKHPAILTPASPISIQSISLPPAFWPKISRKPLPVDSKVQSSPRSSVSLGSFEKHSPTPAKSHLASQSTTSQITEINSAATEATTTRATTPALSHPPSASQSVTSLKPESTAISGAATNDPPTLTTETTVSKLSEPPSQKENLPTVGKENPTSQSLQAEPSVTTATPSTSSLSLPDSTSETTSQNSAKPITAQAKRRAAHARRMKLAFEDA